MFEKLQEIKERFEELNELLMKPEVLSDRNLNRKYSKERAHIEEVVHAYEEYEQVQSDIEAANATPRRRSLREPSSRSCGRARSSSRSASRSCSSRGTPTTTRTPSSRFALAPVARRLRSSRRTSIGCTRATPRGRSGRSMS
jgi:anion-transporting  ArsA/GET3 family ATPase